MNIKINELIDSTRAKFGLDNYYLKRHSLSRKLNILNETVYFLEMEWFPNHVEEQEEEELNPEGTAVIELDINSLRYERVIFVGDISYANGFRFTEVNRDTVVNWIEQETGLSYGKHFKLHKEENGEFNFEACFEDIYFSPSGHIKVIVDHNGNLTLYSKHGLFPPNEMIKKEVYTLSLESIEHLAWKQLKLLNFPSFESEQLIPVYGVEEIYVTNEQKSVIPLDFNKDMRPLEINKPIYWDEPNLKPFERQELKLSWDVTIEQAISNEQSPDSFPISKAEEEKCIVGVTEFLRQVYSNETGNWTLKTLHRDQGYIHAILRLNQEDTKCVFHRKLMIIFDAKSLQAINYMDNQPFIDQFGHFSCSEEVLVNKNEAYQKIKDHFELTPRYVFDSQQNKYILCGLLDCHYGVRASSGDIISLNDL
ncbi:hypothetical protein F7984_05300 [Pradoshia sp. D12]|uniref:hypothetical protein n=1 Tax=Bacillaceae TaxID=186817 RepID=UPI00080AEACF|nr:MULTISPECIES: hypothetical protein [Bacillaceae]OCA89900.1 hypothetical protein A8L44_02910 [Bacillus sp. FJAT-27986]QFK70697.1 hypothetical protein F7984_05300 [Pradoshia sp. D12]TPF72492.1 hypothetical protein FHY44_01695 [Bacillus sp. D12]